MSPDQAPGPTPREAPAPAVGGPPPGQVPEAASSVRAPLSSGPLPLTVPAAWGWASVVLIGTLLLGYGLPMLASRIAEVTVPPGSITFGSASIIPAADWTVARQTSTSVTLDKQGVQVVFRSVSAQGASAAARLLDIEEEMRAEFSQLTVASDPQPFTTPTGAPGQLAALAGSSQTAVIASVVEADQAVDVQSLGESTQFGEAIVDIEAMITSIRIVQSSDG